MISTIIYNLIEFGKSMPTNLIIIFIICLIMKVMGKSVIQCVKFIFGYLLIGLLLGLFGIRMPNFLEIGQWIGKIVNSIW